MFVIYKLLVQAISDGVPCEISGADKNSDADKIKEIEKEVEALKVKQRDELEAALSRLETARGQPGVGVQVGSRQLDNLKTLLRRDFRIAGMVASQGQKDQLSFVSLNRQIEDGLQRGYSEREVIDAVIKCISPSLPPPSLPLIEAMRETGIAQVGSGQLDNLKTLLRRDFRIAGMVVPQGQKDQLSFVSLNRQIEDGLQRGYSEREVIDAVINCISPSLPPKLAPHRGDA